MLEYFKTPEEVEEYLFLTPTEIWPTFAEQFELAINNVKEDKESDEELMGRMTALENRLRKRAEGEEPPSEESIDDDAQLVENGSFLDLKLAQKKVTIEKEGGKQAEAIRAKEREDGGRQESKKQNTHWVLIDRRQGIIRNGH